MTGLYSRPATPIPGPEIYRLSACRDLCLDGLGLVIEDVDPGIGIFFVDKALLQVAEHLGRFSLKAFQVITRLELCLD